MEKRGAFRVPEHFTYRDKQGRERQETVLHSKFGKRALSASYSGEVHQFAGFAPANLFGADLDFWHLPCMPPGTNVLGGFFLFAVYCLIIYKASKILADALETLEVHCGNAKLIAGLLSPVVGAMPDTILTVIVTKSQADVSKGMSMLVGSNALLLTLPFAIAVFLGRVNLKVLTPFALDVDDGGEKYVTAAYGEEDAEGNAVAPHEAGWTREFFLRTGVTVHGEVTEQALTTLWRLSLIITCALFDRARRYPSAYPTGRVITLVGFSGAQVLP